MKISKPRVGCPPPLPPTASKAASADSFVHDAKFRVADPFTGHCECFQARLLPARLHPSVCRPQAFKLLWHGGEAFQGAGA